MHRRGFLASAGLVGLAADPVHPAAPGPVLQWRQFAVTTRVTLLDQPGRAHLWLPLAQTARGYQTVLDTGCGAMAATKSCAMQPTGPP
jgi:hypothetical protein